MIGTHSQEAQKLISFTKPKLLDLKSHFVRVQFDEAGDHYLISSSFQAGPNNAFIDGAIVAQRLEQYMKLLYQSAEDFRRELRKPRV